MIFFPPYSLHHVKCMFYGYICKLKHLKWILTPTDPGTQLPYLKTPLICCFKEISKFKRLFNPSQVIKRFLTKVIFRIYTRIPDYTLAINVSPTLIVSKGWPERTVHIPPTPPARLSLTGPLIFSSGSVQVTWVERSRRFRDYEVRPIESLFSLKIQRETDMMARCPN